MPEAPVPPASACDLCGAPLELLASRGTLFLWVCRDSESNIGHISRREALARFERNLKGAKA